MLRIAHLVLVLSFSLSASASILPAQQRARVRAAYPQRSAARQIIGNVYEVASSPGQVYLIATPKGHIVLDCGDYISTSKQAKSASKRGIDQVIAGITTLGFRVEDVRILLNSHEHADHAGCLGELKQRSGARIVASDQARRELESWRPPLVETSLKVDRVISDGDTVSLGGVTLTARLTPAHTPGALTWTTAIFDHGKSYTVVFEPSMNPTAIQLGSWMAQALDFERSLATWRTLQPDWVLGAHSGSIPDRDSLGQPIIALTRARWEKQVEDYEQAFRHKLAQHVNRLKRHLTRKNGEQALIQYKEKDKEEYRTLSKRPHFCQC